MMHSLAAHGIAADLIQRAIQRTNAWLARDGLEPSGIPDAVRPRSHQALRTGQVALHCKKGA
jgi:hypothetical protein